ncbi:Heparinase II/III-like protein [Streptosporangium canum]|uniref:Heparinase II/III-like protein n=1 Tax=Streptosporangium canum TaxID=324952 RepID=A0A1I3JR36_9ACTN|nr:heparinase II/III family protein [Streptosporangium canum]SFI62693.1 Heparinase II/III-like protein [Streptosporangium canum]
MLDKKRGIIGLGALALTVLTFLTLLACGPVEFSLADSRGRVTCPRGQFSTVPGTDAMRGRVAFVGLPPVELGRDIDWRADPYRNRSWALNLHTLRWMGRLVVDYEATGRREYLDRAAEIARDWVRDNPRGKAGISPWAWAEHPVALRAPALVCLSAHVKDDWLAASLAEHAGILADAALYKGGHNHGLDQDIALLGIGCRFGEQEWTALALRRMTASAELAIDAQGVLREQAPRYGLYVHQRMRVAMDEIKDCGVGMPAELTRRWRSLEDYIAHATQPDGRLAPIGDSPADLRPKGISTGEDTVKVFTGGYVFGRTAWNDADSAYYSIRFGPGRALHGHEDHLGVTYHARRRDILVEAGFHSYEKTPYQRWTLSPQAHNVPVVVGADFREGTAARLLGETAGRTRQSFRFADEAYGLTRTRSVLVEHGTDLMAVLDAVPRGRQVRPLWHLGPTLSATAAGGGRVVLADRGWRASLIQLEMPACRPIGGQSVRSGEISPGYLKRIKVPTVVSPAAGALLTVIVPGAADPEISCSGGNVRVRTPDGTVSFTAGVSTGLF